MKQIKFFISNMSCMGCEKVIRDKLILMGGKDVFVSFKKGEAFGFFDKDIKYENIKEGLSSLGYKVSLKKEENIKEKLFIIFLAVFLSLIFANNIFRLNDVMDMSSDLNYFAIFFIGIMTSFHCLSMCSGISLSQSLLAKDSESKIKKILPGLKYNLSRVISYTLTGALAGGLGNFISISDSFKTGLMIISAAFMILLGLSMLNILSFSFSGKLFKGTNNAPVVVGLLNGFMPCGALQAMQIYALGTSSSIKGALSMFSFGMGTFFLMFFISSMSSFISPSYSKKFAKIGSFAILVFGLIVLQRGLILNGIQITPNFFQGMEITSILESDHQYLSSSLHSNKYNNVTINAGIPVIWEIDAKKENINKCNSPIIIPHLKKEVEIKEGINVVEFKFDKPGTYSYSCWMGMIFGKINVV